MDNTLSRLQQLGLMLPPAPPPVANYLGTQRFHDILFISGRKSELTGAVGVEVDPEQAKLAARDTMLLLLSIIKNDIGQLDHIERILKVQGFIRSGPAFTGQPQVLDGASELLIELWGDNGRHARTATGTSQLPYGATIQLDMILQLHQNYDQT